MVPLILAVDVNKGIKDVLLFFLNRCLHVIFSVTKKSVTEMSYRDSVAHTKNKRLFAIELYNFK